MSLPTSVTSPSVRRILHARHRIAAVSGKEPYWRSLAYFNLFRLVLAAMFLLAMIFPTDWSARLNLLAQTSLISLLLFWNLSAVIGFLASLLWRDGFDNQLTACVTFDIGILALLNFNAGGVDSGLGILIVVTLATASLVAQGRMALFYAALATVTLLVSQSYGLLYRGFDSASLLHAALLSAGFFATALLAQFLGHRILVNEQLARQRGVERDNQVLISQRIVEQMPSGVLIIDRQNRIYQSNPEARSLMNSPCNGPLALLAPELEQALKQWRSDCRVPIDSDLSPYAVTIHTPYARELMARFTRTKSSGAEVLVFLEDMGRVREQAQQLKLAALGQLTASIAHEIRNPLSAISHANELLQEVDDDNSAVIRQRLKRIIADNVTRLDRIVRDVLDMGQQSKSEPEVITLCDWCGNFIEQFTNNEQIAPEVFCLQTPEVLPDVPDAPAPPPLTMRFNPVHLQRVLWNLSINALRHASRQPAALTLRLCLSPDGQRSEIHLIDDGSGVSASDREHIFEPFFTTDRQGTGLGLFIARELCAANQTTLQLAPARAGEGAHFIISTRS